MDDESVTGRATQRAYDRSVRGEMDAQGDYDTFIQEVVIPNERWEEFVDHDLRRLRKIIDDGGDAGVEAAELCKFALALALIFRSPEDSQYYIRRSGATADTPSPPVPEVQEVRNTQARRMLSSLESFDKEYKEVRGCLTKQYHTQASLIRFVITFPPHHN